MKGALSELDRVPFSFIAYLSKKPLFPLVIASKSVFLQKKVAKMKKEELLKLFKFYKGEEESPYKDKMSSRWWFGESVFFSSVADFNEDDWNLNDCTIASWLKEGIEEGTVKGYYSDESVPFEKRVIAFYLNLWHGKWFHEDPDEAMEDYINAKGNEDWRP